MGEGGKALLPLKLVLIIYITLSGLIFGSIYTVSLQALRFLVSNELGYEGAGGQVGPCSDPNATHGHNSSVAAAAAANVEIQERTAQLVTVATVVGNLLCAGVTVLASARLDSAGANGQRAIQLLPCVGFVFHTAIYAAIMHYTPSPWLAATVPALVLGASGGFFLQFATMLKFIGHVTDETERSPAILLLATFSFAAQGVAQLGIGYLIEGAGFTVTYAILFLICALTTVFVFFFLPNTESHASRTESAGSDGGVTSLCARTLAVFRDPDTGKWNGALIVSAVALFFYSQISFHFLAILQIVTLGEPFCWSPSLIGYFSTAKLIAAAFGMTLGAKILRTWFDDNGLVQIGFASLVVSAIIPVYARTDAGLFLVAVFGAFRTVPGPILTASVSKLVQKNNMGSIFGVTGGIECLASIMSPTIYGAVYKATVEVNPHMVFRLMAGLTAIPAALIMSLQCWDCTSGAANFRDVSEDTLLP